MIAKPAAQPRAGAGRVGRAAVGSWLDLSHLGSVLVVFAGNGSSALFAVAATWMVANGLTPAQFGVFSVALALMTVLQEVGGPTFDSAVVRFAAQHAQHDPRRTELYLRTGLRLKLALSGALALALAAAAQSIATRIYAEPQLVVPIWWMAAGLFAGNVYSFASARLQAVERYKAFAASRVTGNVAKVGILALLWLAGRFTLDWVPAAWVASSLIGYWVGAALVRQRDARAGGLAAMPSQGPMPYGEVMRFAGWVMASGLFCAVHYRIDTLLLAHFHPAETVGHYAIAYNLMLLMDLVTASVITALLPKVSKLGTTAEVDRFQRKAFGACAVLALAMVPCFLLAAPFVRIAFPLYTDAVGPFAWLFASSLIVMLIYPFYLSFYAENRPDKLALSYALLAASSLALGLLLIPGGGAMGAAQSVFAARTIGAGIILAFVFAGRRR